MNVGWWIVPIVVAFWLVVFSVYRKLRSREDR